MAHYRLTAKCSLPGETANFGLHVTGIAGSAADAATAWAAALTSMWTDATDGLQTHYSTDVEIVAAHAAELNDLDGKQVDAVENSLSLAGTSVDDMLPHEVSVAVTTRGASANKKDRGRFYLPPPAVSVVTAGLLDATVRGHFAEAAAILVNSLQAAAFTPVILHPTFTDTDIAEVDVGDVFDVQRRRRNKLIEARTKVGV